MVRVSLASFPVDEDDVVDVCDVSATLIDLRRFQSTNLPLIRGTKLKTFKSSTVPNEINPFLIK